MTPITDITGVLLAGGQSRRMYEGVDSSAGPRDKCLADLAGRPMLAHVIDTMEPQVARLLINANGDPARFAAFGLPITADPIDGFAGPLAGVLAGMLWSHLHAPQATHVATVSTDAPFVPKDLVARLKSALEGRQEAIAMASSAGHLHPVIGLWPVALADDLQEQLRLGTRKVLHWSDRHGTINVEFPSVSIGNQTIDPFFNANRPEELAEARQLLATSAEKQNNID